MKCILNINSDIYKCVIFMSKFKLIKAMRTLTLVFITLLTISGCKSINLNEDDNLAHNPTTEVSVTIFNTVIKVDFRLDENMRGVINSDIGKDKLANIKTLNDLTYFYETLSPDFLPGYSNTGDDNEYLFSKVEYLLAQECFQEECSSDIRRSILENTVYKQKGKFGVEWTTPCFTRRTGSFLIAIILLKEEDDSFSQALINSQDLQKALQCLNHDIGMDDVAFNNSLIQYAENFLAN